MSKFFYRQLKNICFGPVLGEGSARKVYEFLPDPTLVVKAELYGKNFQNVAEWEVWSWVRGRGDMEKWFAPCVNISSSGLFLLQKRVEPLQKSQLPKRLPAFFCDLKPEHFGLYEGRVVCCDYGLVVSAIRDSNKKLVKVTW